MEINALSINFNLFNMSTAKLYSLTFSVRMERESLLCEITLILLEYLILFKHLNARIVHDHLWSLGALSALGVRIEEGS